MLFMQFMNDLDHISEHILRILDRDGRISNLELAERVGLSPSACLRRVQDLEKRGVITGYRAITDRTKRGMGFVAYVTVGLSRHTKTTQEEFERLMRAAPAVRECHNITGTVEYLLRVEVPDLPAYKRFHTDYMGAFPHLGTITTMVVMGSPKDERA
jgi:Lrp/AsnC family transcriptional regulator, leucine-responsive regulatory protein